MMVVVQTKDGAHLGFILFSSTDDKCIIQITPTTTEAFETEEYKKINEYSDSKEYIFVQTEDGFTFSGNDKPSMRAVFKENEGRLTFEGDTVTSIPVFLPYDD